MRFSLLVPVISGCSPFAGTMVRLTDQVEVFEVVDAAYAIEMPDGATEERLRVVLTSYEGACDVPDPLGVYAGAHRVELVWPAVPDDYGSPVGLGETMSYVATGSDCAVSPDDGTDPAEQVPAIPVVTYIHVLDEDAGVFEGWYKENSQEYVQGAFEAERCEAFAAPAQAPTCGEAE